MGWVWDLGVGVETGHQSRICSRAHDYLSFLHCVILLCCSSTNVLALWVLFRISGSHTPLPPFSPSTFYIPLLSVRTSTRRDFEVILFV